MEPQALITGRDDEFRGTITALYRERSAAIPIPKGWRYSYSTLAKA